LRHAGRKASPAKSANIGISIDAARAFLFLPLGAVIAFLLLQHRLQHAELGEHARMNNIRM
jgi:hypothetical protein